MKKDMKRDVDVISLKMAFVEGKSLLENKKPGRTTETNGRKRIIAQE